MADENYLDKRIDEIETEARERMEKGEDFGHDLLLSDLDDLMEEVRLFKFHDYLGEAIFPKRDLVARFEALVKSVKEGRYDN